MLTLHAHVSIPDTSLSIPDGVALAVLHSSVERQCLLSNEIVATRRDYDFAGIFS